MGAMAFHLPPRGSRENLNPAKNFYAGRHEIPLMSKSYREFNLYRAVPEKIAPIIKSGRVVSITD
jgi:hypothetical protein